MDLRSIINNEGGAGNSSSKQAQSPATPIQAPPQHYREYNQHSSHGSKPLSLDQGQPGQPHFASPNVYQSGPYQGRPSQPAPIQPPPSNDVRSPGPSQYSAQSPYRHTPTGSMSGGYPFPQSATPQSPAQQSSYSGPIHQRDSYQQGAPPPQLQHQGSHTSSYGQPSPRTPTVGTPGQQNAHYVHQRSQSSHSTSTPTSAQSQPPYFSQFPQSPISSAAFPPQQITQQHRQQSQPGTPLGPPISIPRQQSGGFQPPTSPYQQRLPSSGVVQPYPTARASPSHQIPSNVTQRQGSASSAYESHRNSTEEQHRHSQSSRERSLSVSPKTQVFSLPRAEAPISQHQQVQSAPRITPDIQSPNTNTKRKMDDRDSSESLSYTQGHNGMREKQSPAVASPQQPMKKRIRYTEPPIWARSILRHKKGRQPLRTVTNGERPAPQHATNGQVAPPVQSVAIAQPPVEVSDFNGPLGQWETSITGTIPLQEMSKAVADWLYLYVVSRPDAGELKSRGVEIEIEAKLGQLIDQDTHQRVHYPVTTECILEPRNRLSFKSSMTEMQHKQMNDYLNAQVVDADPRNPKQTKPRVKIDYKHRRERDTFFDLPQSELIGLPAAIRELTKRHGAKVRITYDQKTGEELARIVKARVTDLSIYFPTLPLDCRISVNLEMKYDGEVGSMAAPPGGESRPDRLKDRLSYTQSHYQVDLTQVTTAEPGIRAEKEHELEVELNASSVVEQGSRAASGQPHGYTELIEGFVNNIRVLARAVPA